jgi:hypothetical protein
MIEENYKDKYELAIKESTNEFQEFKKEYRESYVKITTINTIPEDLILEVVFKDKQELLYFNLSMKEKDSIAGQKLYFNASKERHEEELDIFLEATINKLKTEEDFNVLFVLMEEAKKITNNLNIDMFNKVKQKENDLIRIIKEKKKEIVKLKEKYIKEKSQRTKEMLEDCFSHSPTFVTKKNIEDILKKTINCICYSFEDDKVVFTEYKFSFSDKGKKQYYDSAFTLGKNKVIELLNNSLFIKGKRINKVKDIPFLDLSLEAWSVDACISTTELEKIIKLISNIKNF